MSGKILTQQQAAGVANSAAAPAGSKEVSAIVRLIAKGTPNPVAVEAQYRYDERFGMHEGKASVTDIGRRSAKDAEEYVNGWKERNLARD